MSLSKYEKNSKMMEIIKTMQFVNADHKTILEMIEIKTGHQLTKDQLLKLIEVAKQQVAENEIEVNKHMEFMVRFGLYLDAMRDQGRLEIFLEMLQALAIKKYHATMQDGSVKDYTNSIVAIAGVMAKLVDQKTSLITHMGFLTKTRAMIEREDGNADFNKKLGVMEDKKDGKIEELTKESITSYEAEINRVV
jgi:hypothetical protein